VRPVQAPICARELFVLALLMAYGTILQYIVLMLFAFVTFNTLLDYKIHAWEILRWTKIDKIVKITTVRHVILRSIQSLF
jgi:hypothetical protein